MSYMQVFDGSCPTYILLLMASCKRLLPLFLAKNEVQHSSHGQQVLKGILDLRHTQRLRSLSAKSRVCNGNSMGVKFRSQDPHSVRQISNKCSAPLTPVQVGNTLFGSFWCLKYPTCSLALSVYDMHEMSTTQL